MREQPVYAYKAWPAWYYGPNDESRVFESAAEVPAGWTDSPSPAPKQAEPVETAEPAPAKAAAPKKKAGRPKKAAAPLDL